MTKNATPVNSAEVELLKARLETEKKDKTLRFVVGLFLGCFVGFFGANWLNANPVPAAGQAAGAPVPAAAAGGAISENHPPMDAGAGGDAAAAMPAVREKLERADQNPGDFTAQMEAAEMFLRLNNYQKAFPYLQRAYDLKPDDYQALVRFGDGNFELGNFEQAVRLYEKALGMKADDVNVRTDLGTSFYNLNQFDRAAQEFRKVIDINPKHETATRNLVVVSLRKGDVASAEDALNKLVAINPSNPGIAPLREDLDKLKKEGKIPTH